ncbi:hypothetical protein Tco_0204588 [Tanacetum coccineum]
MQSTFRGRLKRACNQISYLETPTQEVGLKNPYLICDYCGESHKAEECRQNNPTEQVCLSGGDIYDDLSLLRFYQNDDTPPWGNNKHKEKGENCHEWVVRSKFEDELANFKLKKKFHTKRIGETLDQHLLEMDEDELVLIILGRPFLATTRAIIDIHKGKLSLRVRNETITFNIGKSMKSKHSCNDYLYCADHTTKLVREKWVDTIDHDRKWAEVEEEGDSNEVQAFSFYPRTEPVEPLEWKALENRLKPLSAEPPKLELKELPEHLEYAFLQENNQIPVVISSALSTIEKARLLEFKPSVQTQRRVNPNIKEVVKKEVIKLIDAGLIYPISDSPWIQRISLTGFPAQSVGSSNTDVLDSPCLLVLITGTSQSRQHGKSESDSYYLSD